MAATTTILLPAARTATPAVLLGPTMFQPPSELLPDDQHQLQMHMMSCWEPPSYRSRAYQEADQMPEPLDWQPPYQPYNQHAHAARQSNAYHPSYADGEPYAWQQHQSPNSNTRWDPPGLHQHQDRFEQPRLPSCWDSPEAQHTQPAYQQQYHTLPHPQTFSAEPLQYPITQFGIPLPEELMRHNQPPYTEAITQSPILPSVAEVTTRDLTAAQLERLRAAINKLENWLDESDRRMVSLCSLDLPEPEPPNAHPDWQQPTSSYSSGFNLAPQVQPCKSHADNSRRPSCLHLSCSMEKEWGRELQEGEGKGEERLSLRRREKKLIKHEGIWKQKESDFPLQKKRSEMLNLILKKEWLVYALTNASESAITRIQHGLSMMIFSAIGKWRRSTIRVCSKQQSFAFDPGGDTSKLMFTMLVRDSHLEDKVDFNHGGVDTSISLEISHISYLDI